MPDQPIVSIEARGEAILAVVQWSGMDWETAPEMKKLVAAAATKAGSLPVILVLTKVEYAASIWFGVLLKLLEESKQRGQRLILADIQPRVREALSLTRLDELFEIYATVEDALAQVGQAS